ncbi:hypothetical protein J5X92_11125 [Alteromonas sp. K632G]|uniref:hypothetical protein n=1 Tax=Alteromonas sp. K632G TaxID=2820757 RepID=UPI000C100CF4|nr:hypothetical protein [Alteromonas sp. K632G]MBO7922769.1 hypothetical protein [Alteromonas sp. K632G]PHS55812.1 MAG: hypothetical protein COB03_08520 [Alteromonas sp.]|tara:strand:- start:11828 stop:12529 length:702 start_codon:yes stop_codon:yes gene_type:complete
MTLSPLDKALLMFLREDTWATVVNVQLALKQKSIQATHQYLKRAEAKGLIASSNIAASFGRPQKLVGITELGHAYAWELDECPTNRRVFNSSKISPAMFAHENDLQKLRISAIQNNWKDWRNAKHLGTRLQATRYPDAIASSPANITYCIEVEREIKSSKRLRTIFASHLSMRKKGHWEKILYLCPSSEIAKRLARKASTLSYLTLEGRRISLRNEHLIHFIFADYGYFKSIY